MPIRTARYVLGRAPAIAVLCAAGIVVAQAIGITLGWVGSWRAAQLERADIFEYVAVEYVARTPTSIRFASTAVWHRHVDRIEFVDVLDCDGTFSTLVNNRADWDPRPLTTVKWDYTAALPEAGRSCQLLSVVSAEHQGRVFTQRIRSAPFQIPALPGAP